MTSESFRQLITAESCLVARAKSDCSARTEALARFGLKQLVTSTAPAFRKTRKKGRTLTSCRPSAAR
jgi:hypothetical protein